MKKKSELVHSQPSSFNFLHLCFEEKTNLNQCWPPVWPDWATIQSEQPWSSLDKEESLAGLPDNFPIQQSAELFFR